MNSLKFMKVNWKALARQTGCFEEGNEGHESCSSDTAKYAIEILLGEDTLIDAVDYYISGQPGSELTRFILWQLHPWSAMKHCYDIYRLSENEEDRILAIELLRVVADNRVLPWIDEFLSNNLEGVQFWGIGIVDQLLFSKLVVFEDVENILRSAKSHNNPKIIEQANELWELWSES